MPKVLYKYTCDGVIGSKGRSPCPHGNKDGPVDGGLHCTLALAVNDGLEQGYKRPHDAYNVLPADTTHMCCPDCFREYQRWNEVFPISLEI